MSHIAFPSSPYTEVTNGGSSAEAKGNASAEVKIMHRMKEEKEGRGFVGTIYEDQAVYMIMITKSIGR